MTAGQRQLTLTGGRAFRIADGRRPLLDGTGAALLGGRWNSPGRRVVYAAETYAGALLEILAHSNIGRVPRHHVWIEIAIPAGVPVEECRADALPGWDAPISPSAADSATPGTLRSGRRCCWFRP